MTQTPGSALLVLRTTPLMSSPAAKARPPTMALPAASSTPTPSSLNGEHRLPIMSLPGLSLSVDLPTESRDHDSARLIWNGVLLTMPRMIDDQR